MKNNNKKFLVAAGLVSAVSAIFVTTKKIIPDRLVNLALNRKGENPIYKSGKKLPPDAPLRIFYNKVLEKAEELEKKNLETVTITSADGTILKGHWYGCENAKRTILAMHGWRSSWSVDFALLSEFWFKNDCNVLFPEQRGQGKSEGDYMGFGLLEQYDCLDWINWLNNKKAGSLPLYLAGVSMGASTVLMASGHDLPENVVGIMADCGFDSVHGIWKHTAENGMHLSYTSGLRKAIDRRTQKLIQMNASDFSCVDALSRCKIPILFIHGQEDKVVPVEMTYNNYNACASEKEIFIVPDAEHGMSYYVDTVGYEETVKSFWERIEENQNNEDIYRKA